MGLETANFPDDLVVTNPDGATDPKSAGDDHLKNIKRAIKNAWPGLGGRWHSTISKSANYTIALTDAFRRIKATSALTFALTAAATLGDGFEVVLEALGGDVIVDPNAAELINGAATLKIGQYERFYIWCDGTQFYAQNVTLKTSRARKAAQSLYGVYSAFSATINPPLENGWKWEGEGKALSAHQYTGASYALDTLGNYSDQFANYQGVRGLSLIGTGAALGGIRWVGRGRSNFDDLLVTGFTDVGAYGLAMQESHTATFNAVELSGNYYGFLGPESTYSGPNAIAFNGLNIEGNKIGLHAHSAAGWSFNGDQCGGNDTGQEFNQHVWGLAYNGGYSEQNTNTVTPSADHYFGMTSYAYAVTMRGRWLNGRAAGATYDYVPMRLGFLNGCSFGPNFINVGNRLYRFDVGGSVSQTEFKQNAYGETFDYSDPRTVYDNMPSTILMQGNTIKDHVVFPQGRVNWFKVGGLGAMVPALAGLPLGRCRRLKTATRPFTRWTCRQTALEAFSCLHSL
jgi:hypothetical protein